MHGVLARRVKMELLQRPGSDADLVELAAHLAKPVGAKQIAVDSGADIDRDVFFQRETQQLPDAIGQAVDAAARHFGVELRGGFVVDSEGVERTETSLVMGEVIGYRIRPILESVRREQ